MSAISCFLSNDHTPGASMNGSRSRTQWAAEAEDRLPMAECCVTARTGCMPRRHRTVGVLALDSHCQQRRGSPNVLHLFQLPTDGRARALWLQTRVQMRWTATPKCRCSERVSLERWPWLGLEVSDQARTFGGAAQRAGGSPTDTVELWPYNCYAKLDSRPWDALSCELNF